MQGSCKSTVFTQTAGYVEGCWK